MIATAVLLATAASQACAATGIHKIRHVVIIMQENRSFDNYFGTFRGADGIPMRHGRPTVCMPAPALGHCVRPSHDPHDADHDLWHDAWSFRDDFDHGRMDGFARVRVGDLSDPGGGAGLRAPIVKEAMGYHDQRELHQLLGLRAPGSCSRITCSSRSRAGACRLTCGSSPNGRHAVCGRPTPSAAIDALWMR